MKQTNNAKITALYERLSKDDDQKNDSVSIAHQKHMLEEYARKNGFHNIRHFTDDGVTGTVFSRPGLNAMIEEVKAGNVATVIIKDQSRIGRDVLEVGLLKRTFEENNVRLKTDSFIELVKRYTDFSELTTPMLNEFVERVAVHEGEGRGSNRRVRVDIHLNFIGAFEVPDNIITPIEVEGKRRQEEEQAAKEQRLKELAQERYEQRKQDKRDFTARKKAGLLTPEEIKADEQDRARRREWQKQWRDKRKAAEPPKPPKPLSQNEIIKRKSAGLPLTSKELEIYETWKQKRTEQHRAWRENQKTIDLPIAANQ